MKKAKVFILGVFVFLIVSAFSATASPYEDTVITKSITTDHIKYMKAVGNIDLILIKSDTDKAEIRGVSNIVAGLTFQNNSESMLISEKAADRHTVYRIKITLWLRNPTIQSMSCTGGTVTVTSE